MQRTNIKYEDVINIANECVSAIQTSNSLIIPVLRQSEDTGVQVVLPITCQQVKKKKSNVKCQSHVSALAVPAPRQTGPHEQFHESTTQE